MAAAMQAAGSNGVGDLQEEAPNLVHVPTAMRSSLPLPPSMFQVPGLTPSASLGEGFRVPGIDGPALVRDMNGKSFTVPARMGLSSSMDLPGMCLDNSAPDISSLDNVDDIYERRSPLVSITGNALGGIELVTKSLPMDGTQTASAALFSRVSRRNSSKSSELSYAELLSDPGPTTIDDNNLSPSTPMQRSPAPQAAAASTVTRKKSETETEVAAGPPLPSLEQVHKMLEEQKQCFHSQLEHLQGLLEVQSGLTGVNPLYQEMAISVLGSQGVKKPDEPLTPEALRVLRGVYALKDTVTNKEARDLTSATGATLTQIRDFFATQQSRVKRLIQIAQDEAGRINISPALVSEPMVGSVSGGDSSDKLLDLMRAETSFTGQSRLVQIILQAEQLQLLRLFLEKGGLRILAKWISNAAAEEQTSLIRQILKALLHLPMAHAAPSQLSTIAAAVHKIKSYFVTDIATRARSLLAKWAKLFSSNGAAAKMIKKPEDRVTQQEPGKPSSLSGPDKKKLKTEPVATVKPAIPKPPTATSHMPNLKGLDNSEKPPSSNLTVRRPVEDHANKKRLADLGKEKRKVLLVEEMGATSRRVRDGDGRRSSVLDKASRPLSVDDIQKAKMRARFLQGNAKPRTQDTTSLRASRSPSSTDTDQNVVQTPQVPPATPSLPKDTMETVERRAEGEEYPVPAPKVFVAERGISWTVPPEARVNPKWNMAAGEESKENEIQTMRVSREMEEFYSDPDSIPRDPKDPWDEEQDYDDSLTLQVPLELDDGGPSHDSAKGESTSQSQQPTTGYDASAYDPKLLAILLDNPGLIPQLSGFHQPPPADNNKQGYQLNRMPPRMRDSRDYQQQGGPQYYSSRESYNMYGGYSQHQQQQQQHYQEQASSSYGGAQFNGGGGGGLVNQPVWNVGNNRVSNNNHLQFQAPPQLQSNAVDASRYQARPQNWFNNSPRPGW